MGLAPVRQRRGEDGTVTGTTANPEYGLISGRLGHFWRLASKHPIISAFLITVLQHGLILSARDLWWSDEVRHAGVLMHVLDEGDWLALKLNNEIYPDKPPLYFLYLAVIARLFSSREQWVIFAAVGFTVFLFLVAVFYLAKRLIGDRQLALLAMAMTASGSYFLLLSHYARMDFLFAAFIAASWICFYDGVIRQRSNVFIFLGFLFSALALMTKGPLGFAFPLCGVIGYLWWRKRLLVLIRADFLAGFAFVALVSGLWAIGVAHYAGQNFLSVVFRDQIVGRGLRSSFGILANLRYFVSFPLIFLPWTLVFLFRNSSETDASALSSRRKAGVFFASACLFTGFALVSAIGEKHEYYLLPLLMLAAVLAADRFGRMNERQRQRFWIGTAIFLIVLGGIFLLAGYLPYTTRMLDTHFGVTAHGVAATGGIQVMTGLIIWFWRSENQPFLVTCLLLGQTIWINLLVGLVFASLNPIWSPKAVAQMAHPYIERGYTIGASHGIRGVFAYHFGTPYAQLSDADGIRIWYDEHPNSIVIMPEHRWLRMATMIPDFEIKSCERVVGIKLVLLASRSETSPLPGGSYNCN